MFGTGTFMQGTNIFSRDARGTRLSMNKKETFVPCAMLYYFKYLERKRTQIEVGLALGGKSNCISGRVTITARARKVIQNHAGYGGQACAKREVRNIQEPTRDYSPSCSLIDPRTIRSYSA